MSSETTEGTQESFINRKAVYISGNLGTLYDQCRDQMLKKLNISAFSVTVRKRKTADCELIYGKTDASENLLQMIGIQDDLRMSILLNLLPRTELTSIIDYPHPINEYTRFLRYTDTYRIENLRDKGKKARKQIESSMHENDATHIITNVNWGIYFVAILQLPSVKDTAKQIDNLLERIRSNLNHREYDAPQLTSDEENALGRIISTKVYSNIPALASMKAVRDIYQFEVNKTDHRPIDFGLRPIQKIHVQNNRNNNTLNSLYGPCKKGIEQYLFQLSNVINYFKSFLIDNVSNLLREHLKEQLGEAYMKWLDIKKKYSDEIERLAKLVIDVRRGTIQISQIEKAIHDEQQNALKIKIDELTENIKYLEAKEQLINNLQQKHFQYWNVTKYDVGSIDNEQNIAQTLIRDDRLDRVLCSNDTLNKDKQLEFDRLRDLLVQQHKNNTDLRLFYADFSYCPFKLSDIVTLPRDKMNETKDTSNHITSSPDEIINILLLGDSGVGKSTFINAFVNYLTFETLTKAESNNPVVLIPVSFLITTGVNFDECIVKFGDSDRTNNEDFDHPGQSVTQHCKSYLFNLNHTNGKKLRIIDTPGFGDTRGLDQDDLNMQQILEYINNLTHINAVCFLLKPNMARLNNHFRTCVAQLLDLLGDTVPPLRILLESMPMNDIPFKKANTFCFDNESLRYLVALQNLIQFSELDRNEYEKSWSTSVKESNRLLNYISNNLSVCYIDDQWKSTKHAQIEIFCMIRPILEAIRNTLRNIILWDKDEKKSLIVLNPRVINCPTTICLSCERHSDQFNNFSILRECPHECLRKCRNCKCGPNKHISIDYILEYIIINNPANHNRNGMTDQLSLLFNACIELTRFLMSTAYSSKNDLVLVGLTQMIHDEKKLCSNNKSNQLNQQLLEELIKLKNKYERRTSEMKPNQNHIELPVIYERIQITRNYPGVNEQMNAVEKGQENMMKYYEQEIPSNSMITNL